jgi:hypothetical protein
MTAAAMHHRRVVPAHPSARVRQRSSSQSTTHRPLDTTNHTQPRSTLPYIPSCAEGFGLTRASVSHLCAQRAALDPVPALQQERTGDRLLTIPRCCRDYVSTVAADRALRVRPRVPSIARRNAAQNHRSGIRMLSPG